MPFIVLLLSVKKKYRFSHVLCFLKKGYVHSHVSTPK